MAADYFELFGLAGADNQGGYDEVYVAPLDWFATIQEPPASGAQGATVKITATHTFDVGKGFVKLYNTKDTAQITSERVGERDGYSYRHNLVFFHPGSKAEALEFAKFAKNDEFIVLAKNCKTGEVIQLGNACSGAVISGAFDSGTNSSGRKGYTFTAESFDSSLILYTGTITLKP